MTSTAPRVTLERADEPWIGRWDGLGTVRVWADGRHEIELDAGAAPEVEAALRHGWAELLSSTRRGHWAAYGTTLAAPDGSRALLVTGDGHDTAIVALALCDAGWSVIADRPAPLEIAQSTVIAHPNPRPVIASARRVERSGRTGSAIRTHSDVRSVNDIPRATSPTPVHAIAAVRRQRPGEAVLAPARGHAAIETLGRVLAGGALLPDADVSPAASMARHLTLARCATARLALDTGSPEPAIEQLLTWWATA